MNDSLQATSHRDNETVEGILINGLTQLTFNCKKYKANIVVLVFINNSIECDEIQDQLFGYKSVIPADLVDKVTFLVIDVSCNINQSIMDCFKIVRAPTFVINKTVYNAETNTNEFRRILNLETIDIAELVMHIKENL